MTKMDAVDLTEAMGEGLRARAGDLMARVLLVAFTMGIGFVVGVLVAGRLLGAA